MTSYSWQVGDGIVQKLEVDFSAKRTAIYLTRWVGPTAEEEEKITILFTGVALQNFKDFSTFNLFSDMEEATDAKEFWHLYSDWLERNKNYQSRGVLENIAADTSLRYFSVEASHGVDGFIICKDLLISTQGKSRYYHS
ncbi:hypothetical protein QMK33_11840 [Hymenobacter sp. H14-R3]|uniref:hypothetical protein n=1 Tax=Hymenobacter sp. H14-R3 TaxID=3046308 RepID=UPI0024B95627|nr:hypothetical protein [Hymenobacter sp. H14-R3]MDJ0365845.1 hypothetical protein [Hymenobacter sp. H14-R3]